MILSLPHPGHILLIEDHREIAEMLFEYLEGLGYTLDHAGDGLTGLHLAITQTYDVIILDLMLYFTRPSFRFLRTVGTSVSSTFAYCF